MKKQKDAVMIGCKVFFKKIVGEYLTMQISNKWYRTQDLNPGWEPSSQW
jgi:hypothetical protein